MKMDRNPVGIVLATVSTIMLVSLLAGRMPGYMELLFLGNLFGMIACQEVSKRDPAVHVVSGVVMAICMGLSLIAHYTLHFVWGWYGVSFTGGAACQYAVCYLWQSGISRKLETRPRHQAAHSAEGGHVNVKAFEGSVGR